MRPARAWAAASRPAWPLHLATLLIAVTAWEALARHQQSLLLPGAGATAAALIDLLRGPLPGALWVSNRVMLVGFALAAVAGVPLGLLLGRVSVLERGVDLYLSVLLVTPMAALTPILIMAFGLGPLTRTLVVVTFALPTVVVNARAGLRGIDASLVDMARAFGAGELHLWRRVFLPGAAPAIFAGLRLGLARALAGMVVVELLLVAVGMGDLILRYQGEFQADYMFAVIVAVMAEAVVLIGVMRRIEARVGRWAAGAAP